MGWKKGQKRGPSPLAGRKVLAVEVAQIRAILSDTDAPIEVRFCAVMELLLPALAESTNKGAGDIGTLIRHFWDNDMEDIFIGKLPE